MQTKLSLGSNSRIWTPFLIALLIFSLLAITFWNKTWDDSAITIGFSRNLAKYGDIIPSQHSDRVEGYSSFLWMIINTVFFKMGFNENQVLTIAKVLSFSFTVINIYIFNRILSHKIKHVFYHFLILTLYVINATTVGAAIFGMETALYALLMLASFELYKKRSDSQTQYVLFTLISSMLMLIRHEGVIFLFPFFIHSLLCDPRRVFREPFIYFWGLIFFTYHSWHFMFFGEFLTNPMMAKAHWPYRTPLVSIGDIIGYFTIPFFDMVIHFCVVTILAATYYIKFRNHPTEIKQNNPEWQLMLWIGITGLFIMLITGNRWGAAQRLSYPSLPFLLLIVFSVIDRVSITDIFKRSKISFALILLGLVISIEYILFSFQGTEFQVTVTEVHKWARPASVIQEFLGKEKITFASPDMGGLMLFESDNKRIIDLGLLCDKRLGKQGYAEIESYLFQEEKPEIIKAHDVWITPLVESHLFFEMYIPTKVITNDSTSYLFIRKDLLVGFEEIKYVSSPLLDTDLNQTLLKFGNYVILDLQKIAQ